VLLIGSLEQFNLSNVLQRIEAYAKTGLLIVKQEEKWVELSFRQGLLMCIGPVRSNKTLGDRLLQAGVISQGALQEVISVLGSSLQSETRTAITLSDLGYVNQESLYNWAATEALKVLQVLLTWFTGEIYFEEGMQPPADRLLIALSVSSLLPQQSAVSTPQPFGVSSAVVQEQPETRVKAPSISNAPTLHNTSQFLGDGPAISWVKPSRNSLENLVTDLERNIDSLSPSIGSPSSPQRVSGPLVPRHIDTSFMQPQMVLTPTDLSALWERNPKIELTPEQWRLFTCADGQTTLQMACQLLVMPRELVCQVAGELIALGLVTISMPVFGLTNESVPSPQDPMNAGSSKNYVPMSGYSVSPVPLMGAAMLANNGSNYSSPAPIETHSQWGNGGNGATFVLGGGWVVASSPFQPVQSSGLDNFGNKVYAGAGGVR
jgi:Domain of unknown function (DUF4388)